MTTPLGGAGGRGHPGGATGRRTRRDLAMAIAVAVVAAVAWVLLRTPEMEEHVVPPAPPPAPRPAPAPGTPAVAPPPPATPTKAGPPAPPPAAAADAPPADPRPLLRGRAVIRAPDGSEKPAPGARFVLHELPMEIEVATGTYWNTHRFIVCDGDGRFEAPVPPDDEVVLLPDPGDAAFAFPAGLGKLRFATDAASLADEVRVQLSPRGRASGIVLDPAGEPVAGASISFAAKITQEGPLYTAPELGSSRTLSGPDGRFTLEGLPVGRTLAAVAAKAPFRKSLSSPFQVPEGGTVEGIEIRLLPGCAITGLVTDPAGAPLPGAQVRVTTGNTTRWAGPNVPADLPDEAVAGPDGRYRIEGLEQRAYSVFATLEGHTPADLGGIHATAAGTEAGPLVLVRGGVLRGIVVDAEGQPLTGASITLQGENRSGGTATTGADGRFEIRPVVPGSHTLYAGKVGFVQRPPESLELAGGEEIRIVLERGYEITGTVLDFDGKPVPQARVQVHPWPTRGAEVLGVAMTDPRGRFSVGGLPAGSHGIAVTAVGHVFPDFPPVPAGTTTVELRTARSVFIAGRVLKPEGEPFPDAWVEVADGGGVEPPDHVDLRRFRRVLTDGEGCFRAEGLLGGPFHLLVRARDDLQEESLRDVPGDSDGLVLRMRRREGR